MTSRSLTSPFIRALRTGWWALVGSILVVMGVAVAIQQLRPVQYTATAVLAVPPSVGTAANNPATAAAVATSQRLIITRDETLRGALARQIGSSARALEGRIRVSQPGSSSLLQITFVDPSARRAERGARALTRMLTADPPVSAALMVGALRVVNRPSAATKIRSGYAATSVVVADAGGSQQASNADGARRLALTYAALIPEDQQILDAVSKGLSRDFMLVAKNHADTSIVELNLSSDDEATTVRAARNAADAVSGINPVSDNIAPGSLAVVRLPTAASGGNGAGLAPTMVGGMAVGLILGLLAMVGLERRQRRVLEPRDLREVLGVSATALHASSGEDLRWLVDRWREDEGRGLDGVDLMAPDARSAALADQLARSLNNGSGIGVPVRVRFAAAAAGADDFAAARFPVVVARAGTPAAPLEALRERLDEVGRPARWALLVR
jgi:capsular polysaccharide biosynthesis protein